MSCRCEAGHFEVCGKPNTTKCDCCGLMLCGKHHHHSPSTRQPSITYKNILDTLYECKGLCLDQERWEFISVAVKLCDLLELEYPKEWTALLEDKV